MNNKMTRILNDAVESDPIKNSTSMSQTILSTNSGLLNNNTLTPTLVSNGTALVTQNDITYSDVSRYEDPTDLVEMDWNYKTTTSKPYIMKTILWKATDVPGQNILTFTFPNEYFRSNHILETVGDTFLSFRGDLHFIVNVQGTPFASGALIVCPDYAPYPLNSNPTLSDAFVRQFVLVDASDNVSTSDLVVPFKHYRNGVDPFRTITQIHVNVLAPLGGVTAMNVTVTCFLENQNFKFIRPQTYIPTLRETQGLVDFTTINNTLSDIQNATLPINMTGDSLNIKASPMDDVGIPTNPSSVLIKFNSMNNVDNPHSIEKMAMISKSQRIATPATFNTTMDEMSILHIMKDREHLIESFPIKKDVLATTRLRSYLVTPTPHFAVEKVAAGQKVNLAEHLCDGFKFWRGGMRYKFRFYMNRFQTIKLYFGLFYKSMIPANFSDWSASHGAIVDIGGDQREVIIEVPYNSENAWSHIAKANLDLVSITREDFNWTDYLLGSLGIYAVTPLLSPDGSPTTINCVVTKTFCEDFELANFTPVNRSQAGEAVVLSKHSLRTPNYITDVVTSMKQYHSKYQLVAEKDFVDLRISNFYNVIFPQDVLTRFVNDQTVDVGNTQMQFVGLNNLEKMIHTHYSGGLKIKIELELTFRSNTTPNMHSVARPICLFCNPDGTELYGTAGKAFASTILANQLNTYQGTIGTNGMTTPYMPTHINTTGSTTRYTFELEVPYQRVIKYAPVLDPRESPRFTDYGYIAFGFKYLNDIKVDGESYRISSRVYAKIADDGRFATIEKGSFDTKGQVNTWIF